ncbi:hypothetical protein GCM10020218_005010 [Dactylosporangium vinaceum]
MRACRADGSLGGLARALHVPSAAARFVAGEVPRLPAYLIEGVGGPGHDVERVRAHDRGRTAAGDDIGDPVRPPAEMWMICALRAVPSASKNARSVARSRPELARTSRPES